MLVRYVCALALICPLAVAQNAISAHSGMVNYVEGRVTLDAKKLDPKPAEFPQMRNGQLLEAEDGRSEVLLTPGVFLRVAENSSFRMISDKLEDTKLEVLSGSILVEVDELLKSNSVQIQFQGASVVLAKHGLYRFDMDANRLRVYDGEARVTPSASNSGDVLAVKAGREVVFGAVPLSNKFDNKTTDAFYRWSARRGDYIARANISSANTANTSSSFAGYGAGSRWAFNPWYGLYTFIPGNGYGYSPFGYRYFSPSTVSNVYYAARGNAAVMSSGFPSAAMSGPRYDANAGYTVAPRQSLNTVMAPPSMSPSSGVGEIRGGMGGGAAAAPSAPAGGGMVRGAAGGGARGR